jgi:hypothetical protein
MRCVFTFRPIVNWPHQKTQRPKPSAFRVNYDETLDLLDKELRMLGVRKAVIQVDLPESKIRLDGLPYAGARPEYKGIILSFESKYGPLRYMTDVFDSWQDNLRAIALGLEALRKVDRYGITKKGEQYTGWKQLPASIDIDGCDVHKAAEFLSRYSGYEVQAILKDKAWFKEAWRIAARKLHPDKGGDKDNFSLLTKIKKLFEGHFND